MNNEKGPLCHETGVDMGAGRNKKRDGLYENA
jgi:hypothetical protein